MSDPEPYKDPGSDYLVARFFVGLLALLICVLAISIAWGLHTGIMHSKSGTILRADDPTGFWFAVIVYAAIIAVMGGVIFRLLRFTERP